MKVHSLIIVSALAMGFAVPAMAQSSTMHRYISFFKYTDAAAQAMTENPQDRSAPVAKLYESFGGKLESIYFFATGGEYDGFIVSQMPDDMTSEALGLMVRSSGNFAKNTNYSLLTAEEFKAAMEKAKAVRSSYTPPTATKQ